MAQIFTIGKKGNQPFKITADGVSGEHARITIDNGQWYIEDLDSTNGTFLKDSNGEFVRIYKKQIFENSIIRLAKGGHHSHTFTAHRLLAPENDYSYEFLELRKTMARQLEEEKKQEQINTRNGWIAKCAGVAAILLCTLIGAIPGVTVDPNIRYVVIAFAPIIVGLLFRNDAARLKAVKNRRRNLIVCPKCGRPISDFDVDNMQCSVCKAK